MEIHINDNDKYLGPKQNVKKLRKKYKKMKKEELVFFIRNKFRMFFNFF